jgi:threonine aldolase
MLGGGMRQAGVMAAAGIISLEKMTKRLGEDHARARKLAEGLRQIPGLVVDAGSPSTNMVYMNLSEDVKLNSGEIVERMKKHGVMLDAENSRRFRLVTHYWIDDAGVEKTLAGFREVLR